ncbi:hypothetical protein UY3_07551 [Chelonia mydas]|uniref:Uncharacterized protein n=1 Tax=Chelonia mydas TaxID=8469 RepID=M7BDR2_CHEMY|nr:hypothetical protein UY3_07551 [Chelonia mydas]
MQSLLRSLVAFSTQLGHMWPAGCGLRTAVLEYIFHRPLYITFRYGFSECRGVVLSCPDLLPLAHAFGALRPQIFNRGFSLVFLPSVLPDITADVHCVVRECAVVVLIFAGAILLSSCKNAFSEAVWPLSELECEGTVHSPGWAEPNPPTHRKYQGKTGSRKGEPRSSVAAEPQERRDASPREQMPLQEPGLAPEWTDALLSGEADEDPEEVLELPVAEYPKEIGDLWTTGPYTQSVVGSSPRGLDSSPVLLPDSESGCCAWNPS